MCKNGGVSANPKNTDYDVIVIGTGMGGSAAGAISALNGMRTLILEKNPQPGGACSYYTKGGFHVDTGTHLFIRCNRGPFGALTKRLGMGTPIDFITHKYTAHFKGFNVDVKLPGSMLAIAYEMVIPRLMWQTRINPIHYPSIARLFFDIFTMRPHKIEALNNVSVEEFMLGYTKNPDMRVLLSGILGLFFIVPPWEASMGESVWCVQQSLKGLVIKPTGYPKGGCVSIPKTFLKGAEKHGATLRLNAGVRKINIEDGKVAGVTLENGTTFSARAVISTSNVHDTVDKLTGADYFPTDYVSRMRGIKPSWTAVQAKIGLKKKLIDAGVLIGGVPLKMPGGIKDRNVREFIGELDAGVLPKMQAIYAPVPSNFDPTLAPEGCQVLTVVMAAPTADIELKDGEQAWTNAMMNSMYELVPGLKENIVFCDTWTVKTLANWIGKGNGSAITTAQTTDQVGYRRPPHATPIPGLYLAGDCAGPTRGVGTELACQSGMDCADLVSSHIYNRVL